MTLLRPDLLSNRTILLAGGTPPALTEELRRLGGRVGRLDAEQPTNPAYALVYDAGEAFARGGLRTALDTAWEAVHTVSGVLIERQGRKIILIGPRAGTAPLVDATRDALENLARTLSVEWARYGITATMIAPGEATTERDLIELVAYLLSPAGDYFSGCRFSLGLG